MKKLMSALLMICAFYGAIAQSNAKRQRFAAVGNLKLTSCKQINNCKIGYLTYGKLNADKSNAILFPTWFLGTSQQIADGVKPWSFIDTNKYHLIIADALANGVSTSPSNSVTQHGPLFPAISIEDMVEAHHRLLVQKLGIQHLYAIAGISMGAFQAYQWSVSYPDFMDRILAIVGSPQLTGYDIVHVSLMIKAIDDNAAFKHGRYTKNPSIPLAMGELVVSTTTPENIAKKLAPKDAAGVMETFNNSIADWNNFRTQLSACRDQDIARKYNSSLAEAVKHIKAKMLLVNNKQDHLVNSLPVIEFAKLLPAKLLLLDNDLGHVGIDYSDPTFKQDVKELLESKP